MSEQRQRISPIKRRGLLAGLVSLWLAGPLFADSLWRRRDPQCSFLSEDSRARRPGDLLTVIINESTEVDNSENKALNKSSAVKGVFDFAASSTAGFGDREATAAMDLASDSARQFSGAASYKNSREILDRITVTVIEVQPNGNLVLSGRRQITVAGETRMMTICGVARSVDIGPDNTISSRFIANMQTVYEDDGAERHFTRQGWLSRKMNRIWPF